MKIIDYKRNCMLFRTIFYIQLNEYIDPISFTLREPTIDLLKFERWLKQEHPYNENIYSIKDIVKKHYGNKGTILLEELL